MSTNNLCHETCRIVFINMTAKSKLLPARQKMAQVVKMPSIAFPLARLIFTGQSSHRPFRNSSGNWGEFQILTNR